MSEAPTLEHRRACHLCEAICGLVIETQGEQILSIKGDPDDPLSRGHICPKGVALQDLHNDPDRLRQPVKRVRQADGSYLHIAVSWDEALDTAAAALVSSVQTHGVDSIGVYLGNPSVHNYGMLTHQGALFKHLRTKNRFSATSVDQLPHHLVSLWLYGHKSLLPVPDIDRTDFFLMLGANPLASNGSIWTVPGVRKRIKALVARGGKLVVIDPRRTETANLASEHHFIKPGADAVFLLALIHVILRDGLSDLKALSDFTDGIADVERAVASFTPEVAAAATGIDAETVVRLATEMAAADRAVCYGRMGVSTQEFGTICQWATQVLNVITGNLDREGGSLFTRAAVDQVMTSGPGGFNRHQSRVRGLPEFDRELPAAARAEEIATPGEGQIRVLFTGAGNPVLSTPSGHKLDAALENLTFMVSLDPYINETTRHADIILPPTSPLEHDHYDIAFHNLAVRNTARFNEPVFEKPEAAMHDWEIFEALGQRVAEGLGLTAAPSIPPSAMIDAMLRAGPWGDAAPEQLSLAALRAAPSGIDLGPLTSQLPARLQSAERRINLAVSLIINDMQRLTGVLPALTAPGYRLIGRRDVRDNNSWMHNHHRLIKGKPRCTLLVNPSDAKREGWQAGTDIRVVSAAGSILAPVAFSDDMMPGVVSLPHGYGHGRQGGRMNIADQHAGVSCNDVTDNAYIDALSGNAAVNGVPVELMAS